MMDNKEFSKLLEKRTRDFGVRIIRLSTELPNTPEGREIRRQITKSGTSVGASYREANRARSRADFKNKIRICESEASETQYWLEVIGDLQWLSWERLNPEYEECGELLAIFSSIGKK
jgi:four helix bundle protein